MKTNRLFCKIQKFNNAKKINVLFTLLVAFFMTFSTVGQTDGIEFQCGQNTITFGSPDGEDINGFPTWSNGELVSPNVIGWTLFVEDLSGTLTWAVYAPSSIGGERYYFSTVFNGTSPSCSYTDWSSEIYLDCTLSNITCAGSTPEICDGLDNDGDGLIDEDFTIITYYADVDQDGFGDPSVPLNACDGAPEGYVTDNTDCFDDGIGAETAYLGASEIPGDLIDNDCDGEIDENDEQVDIPVYCNEAKTKVLICHNGKDKCVSINAIDAHLDHGDSLGSCNSARIGDLDDAEAQDELEANLTTFNVVSWPNPTTNLFNVRIKTPNLNDKVHLQAFNVNGRLIHTNVINGNEDYKFGELLSSGMYFIKLSQANITQVIKVIKH